jgi:hypothetical protein
MNEQSKPMTEEQIAAVARSVWDGGNESGIVIASLNEGKESGEMPDFFLECITAAVRLIEAED